MKMNIIGKQRGNDAKYPVCVEVDPVKPHTDNIALLMMLYWVACGWVVFYSVLCGL